jgi:hypothetical protein
MTGRKVVAPFLRHTSEWNRTKPRYHKPRNVFTPLTTRATRSRLGGMMRPHRVAQKGGPDECTTR